MANMSYCRFENTLSDLRDCQNALQEEGLKGLSGDELMAARRLIALCSHITEDFGAEGN